MARGRQTQKMFSYPEKLIMKICSVIDQIRTLKTDDHYRNIQANLRVGTNSVPRINVDVSFLNIEITKAEFEKCIVRVA